MSRPARPSKAPGNDVDELDPDASLPPEDADDLDDDPLAAAELDGQRASQALTRRLPRLLVIGGLIGFAAAFALLYERIELLLNPDHATACDFGTVVSCSSVMTTPQGSVFGFPNPMIGIASFAIVTTIGMGLLAGAAYRRWFWLGLQAGVVGGLVFVIWLMYQSMIVINRLCPYCMVVWAVMIPLFWYVTVHNFDRGHIPVPAGARWVVDLLVRNRAWLLALLYFIPLIATLVTFRAQLATLF